MKRKRKKGDDGGRETERWKMIMEIMDCYPGNAGDENGPPLVVFQIAHKGELEPPMVMSVSDAEKFVTKILISLATHDCRFATKLIEEDFMTPTGAVYGGKSDRRAG